LRAGELRRQGVRIRLEDQPFQILTLLLERPGELVTREELRNRLWPAQTFVDFDRRLNVAVARLRSALGDSGDSPRYIETLYRRGYRFLVPVTEHRPALPEVPAAPLSPSGRRRRPLWILGGVLTVLGALALPSLWLPRARPDDPRAASVRRSVAVLGLKDLSQEPRHAWLSTALSEWLTTELQAGEHLRTIPAQRVARMEVELSLSSADATAPDSLARIRDNLGTELVVVGSYALLGESSGGQIRLDLRLLDVQSGETLAALSETGVEADLSGLVSRAGAALRTRLGVPPITREEEAAVTATLPSDPKAARLYSEGLVKLRLFDALAARDLLRGAVAAEPGYALSHAALATAWAELGYDLNARDEAQRALDLSAGLSRTERLLVKGRYHEMVHDWAGAEDVYRALFQFFPDNLEYGLALAEAQVYGNRWKELLATVGALRELPPPMRDDPRIDLAESLAGRFLGDPRRAEASGARAVDRARALGASLTLAKARVEQAWHLKTRGRIAEADEAAREAEQIYRAAGHRAGAARAATVRAAALQSQGDYRGARRIYEEALVEYRAIGHKRGLAVEHNNLGSVLLDLGDVKGARRHFEDALATYTETRDPGGLTLAKLNLGKALLVLGEHGEARRLVEESLAGGRQMGDRSRSAQALLTLGEVFWQAGDPDAARRSETEALAIFAEVGRASDAARAELVLAEFLLDQGHDAEAEARARKAAGELERARNVPEQRRAEALAARASLQQGRIGDARRALEKAVALGGSQSRQTALEAAITTARLVDADSGRPRGSAEATQALQAVIAAAERAEFVKCAFEARLALAEIEMKAGDGRAQRRLSALAEDAHRRGFRSLAQRAVATLERAGGDTR
jgi:DNA-binding winged helix-turn-helix (wHTH) protein/tetratricopeptide (TPR) repeat protein/TolB-like protein